MRGQGRGNDFRQQSRALPPPRSRPLLGHKRLPDTRFRSRHQAPPPCPGGARGSCLAALACPGTDPVGAPPAIARLPALQRHEAQVSLST
ncbi:UNVERIFIED_CONTAM: hypothetical protein K2H54_040497 [Gekko kuhli]